MANRRPLSAPPSANHSNSFAYKCPVSQLPSIDSLTNAPGVGCPKSEQQTKTKTRSPLESALAKNAPVTPLQSALPKSLALKPFRIRTCRKWRGEGQMVNQRPQVASALDVVGV